MPKHTYIYRVEAGYSYKDKPEIKEFFYARNKDQLLEHVKEVYKEKKYDLYKTTKVGLSKYDEETRLISDFESWQLKQNMTAEAYSERIEP